MNNPTMKRREFLMSSAVLAGGSMLNPTKLTGIPINEGQTELAQHIIDRVEFGKVNYHWPRHVGKNARIGIHGQYHTTTYLRLHTDQGASGWGLVNLGGKKEEAVREEAMGKTVTDLVDPEYGIREQVSPALDFALHDLAGIILNKPVYELLGAEGSKEYPVYSGMIYFDELDPEESPAGIDKVLENCQWDYDYGYRQLKVKIGRSGRWYTHSEGLAMDIMVVKMIHEKFGDDVGILVDANDMYSLEDTISFLNGVEEVPIYWVEEPFVENLEEGRKLKEWMESNGRSGTYYADGERQPDHEVCRQLASEQKLDVYLPDIVGLGFTAWRKLMPELINSNTLASPHAWGSLLKTQYTSHLAAGLGNVCTIEGVTCISEEIDFGDYQMIGGKLRVSNQPGFGMKLLV
jgi:L-alanine-DL-glutamate epimerase-like enolase superfamily enzyme